MIVLRYLAENARATLPSDEKEAGVFLSGMCYMFVAHWVIILVVTYLWAVTR